MKNAFEFKTLAEFMDFFKDEDTCREHFAAIRFANGEYCPHCKHDTIYKFSGGKRYRCASCRQDFTIKTGTVFGESKLPLRKWFIAIYLLSTSSKGISSVQLAKHVGVTQKTGWFMDHRIRSAMKQGGGRMPFGTVEADETYVGGLEKNRHRSKRKNAGSGPSGKAPVFGIRSRGDGTVHARVMENVAAKDLHPIIREKVTVGSTVMTDNWAGYKGLIGRYDHKVVHHSLGQYVMGDAHTNGIESFWALFKRGYHGIYHYMSKKHLQRYVDEYTFRFNRRIFDMDQVFKSVVKSVAASPHLGYNELTA